ncbi:MAG: PAS domain S-box protein, partial [Anaerolineales bacterium]|nr:PAS domain S-box protein [Anaerolineales bacterium]
MKIRSIALKAAGTFALLGTLWIIGTDLAASYLAPDLAQLAIFQLIKGIVFIFLASALLYHFLSSRLLRQQMNLAEELRRTEELEALAEISSTALAPGSIDQVLQKAVRRVAEILDYDVAFVLECLPERKPHGLSVRAVHGMPLDHVPRIELQDHPSHDGNSYQIEAADVDRRRYLIFPEESNAIFKSGFAADIRTSSDEFGYLAVFDEDEFAPSSVDRTTLRSLADVIGLALARQETHESLRMRAEQNKALTELGERALRIQDLDTLFDSATAMVADQLRADFSKLFAYEPDHQKLRLVSGVGWDEGRVGSTMLDAGGASQAGYTLSVDEPVIVEDFRTEDRFEVPELLRSHNVISSLSAVIQGRNQAYGVIGADTESRRTFTEDDVAFLQSVGNILSEAVQRLESERRSEFQAQLLESVGEAVIATDNEGVVRYWNPGAERLYGWNRDEVIGQSIQELNVTPSDRRRAEEIMATVRGGEAWSGEFLVRDREGEVFPAQVTNTPIRDQKGAMIGIVGVSRDLRDLRAVERKLAESEAFHRMVLANISDAVFLTDEDGEFKYVCVNTQHIFGYSHQQIEQMGNIRQLLDGDLLVGSETLEREGLATNLEVQIRDKEGAPHDLLVNVKRVRIRGGTRLYTCRDITQRKWAEEALAESEARYRSLTEDVLDSSEVGTFILDSDFKVVWINQAIEEFFGIRREKVIGEDKRRLIDESIRGLMENPEQFRSRLVASYDDNTYEEKFECHITGANGQEERWLQHWSQPIQHGLYKGGRIEHYADITDRKRVEMELEQALERFQLVARTTQAALWDYHIEEDWTWRSPAYATAFGYDPEQIDTSFEYWTSRIHPEDRERVLDSLNEWIESGEETWTSEYRFRSVVGSFAWVYDRGFAILDEKGETYRSMGSMIDISDRKRAE